MVGAAAFTAGPWLVHSTNRLIVPAADAFKGAKVNGSFVDGDDLPNSICLLRDPDDVDFDEDQTLANGFLIAAAPELYEIARRAAEDGENYDGDDWARFSEEAAAALAKARGES